MAYAAAARCIYNGEPVRSCLMLAVQADQSEITTVEGLSANGALNSLQQAFKKHHALQCGFCTPGFLDDRGRVVAQERAAQRRRGATSGFWQSVPLHGLSEYRQRYRRSFRRTTTAQAHHECIRRTAKFIGAPVERAEDNELLTGKGVFVDDIDFPGMLHAHVVRSVHARAKILRIDTTAAKRAPGVVDVITFEDLGAVRKLPLTIPHPSLKPLTEFPMARDKVRYVGEPVAVIVATCRHVAEDAAPLVESRLRIQATCVRH